MLLRCTNVKGLEAAEGLVAYFETNKQLFWACSLSLCVRFVVPKGTTLGLCRDGLHKFLRPWQEKNIAILFLPHPCPPQCPSTIGEEKQYNPFLRTHCQAVQDAMGLQRQGDEDWDIFRARVLKEVRLRKDVYKANQ